jgi:hypothetical protein
LISAGNDRCSAVEAALPTPWRRYPEEAAAYLRMSPSSFKRKVRGKVPRKKSGGVELYHVKDLDQWEEDEKVASSSSERTKSTTSLGPRLAGSVRIGPLERQMARKLLGGSRK